MRLALSFANYGVVLTAGTALCGELNSVTPHRRKTWKLWGQQTRGEKDVCHIHSPMMANPALTAQPCLAYLRALQGEGSTVKPGPAITATMPTRGPHIKNHARPEEHGKLRTE